MGIIFQRNKKKYINSHTKGHLHGELITKQAVEVKNVKPTPGEQVILIDCGFMQVIIQGQHPDILSLESWNEAESPFNKALIQAVLEMAQEAEECAGLSQYSFQPAVFVHCRNGGFHSSVLHSLIFLQGHQQAPRENGELGYSCRQKWKLRLPLQGLAEVGNHEE